MNIALVLFAAAICLSATSQRPRAQTSPAGQHAQSAVDPADVWFGFTDSTGSKLLMLPDEHRTLDAAGAKSMVAAVCSEGRVFPIRYVQFQKKTAADNGRQSAGNFVNNEGYLSEILQAHAAPDDTCLLVPEGYLRAFPIGRNDMPKAERQARKDEYQRRPAELTGSAKQFVSRIEKEKGRTAKVYWPLHRRGASQEVAAIEFKAMGDSLLGGLVLVEPTRLSFFDMPASLAKGRENGGCWRVDDDCQFNYVEMDVPAVLGGPGRQLVFFTSFGAEGQVIVLLQAKDGQLVDLRRAYRYYSPV